MWLPVCHDPVENTSKPAASASGSFFLISSLNCAARARHEQILKWIFRKRPRRFKVGVVLPLTRVLRVDFDRYDFDVGCAFGEGREEGYEIFPDE